MTKTLLIESSLNGAKSVSNGLAHELLARLQNAARTTVTVRSLAEEPLPHIDSTFFQGLGTMPEERSEEQRLAVARSDMLISELESADQIILAVPMYNFGIPSALKAWIDHIAVAGRTFQYTENGPIGLLTNKKVYIVAARGGAYSEGPMNSLDFQIPYLKSVLGFVGLTDVSIILAEGLAMGEEDARRAQAMARSQISDVVMSRVAA